MASTTVGNSPKPQLFLDKNAHRLRNWLLIAGCVYSVVLIILIAWIVDSTGIGIFNLSEFGSIVVEWMIAILGSAIVVGILILKLYFGPRQAAYSGNTGTTRIKVFGGRLLLVLWHPGETYVFLKNKRVASITVEEGGEQLIVPALGEEAIGPISLRTEMLPWTDKLVLTREAQPLEIALGVQWRVSEPQKYAFRIASEVHRDATKLTGDFVASSRLASENTVIDPRRPATSWLYLWVESAVRSYISRLGMADMVVSASSLQWLHANGDGETRNPGKFEEMAEEVTRVVNKKAAEYGLEVEGVSVQGIKLPDEFQRAINRTREAFLKPIASEQEAKARAFELSGELETLKRLLGDDAFRMNELLKNFRGANFGYFPFQEVITRFAGQLAATAAAGASNPELSAKSPAAGDSGPRLDKK